MTPPPLKPETLLNGSLQYADLSSLRDNGWGWMFTTFDTGKWIDPKTGKRYRTEEALKIQAERTVK